MIININDYIKVKFTFEGLIELKKQHDEVSTVSFKLPEFDEEGYTKIQLWVFMLHFGHLMCDIDCPYFSTEIMVEDKSVKNDSYNTLEDIAELASYYRSTPEEAFNTMDIIRDKAINATKQ